MVRVVRALRTFLALALPYFGRSEDRWPGRALAAGVVALEFALVFVAVQVNQWHGRFFNALEANDWDKAKDELVVFGAITLMTIATGAAQYWLGQHFQIRWRRWMTNRLVGRWLEDGRHYRLPFVAAEIDNVQLRVVNDISIFIQKTHEVGSSFIGVLITLVSFSVILWGLSDLIPLPLLGHDYAFPGYLIVLAFLFAVIGTLLAHGIGWRLVALNFNQQRREADLRYATQHARDHGEQVALLGAEGMERAEIGRRVSRLMDNWRVLTVVQTRLNGFAYGYNHISAIFPILIVSPAYLAAAIPLGMLVQSAAAFQRVEQAFSFFIGSYAKIAEWRAAMDRIAGLEAALDRAAAARGADGFDIAFHADDRLAIRGLVVRDAKGAEIAAIPSLDLGPGERLLVGGAPGSGKSTLIRAMAGIWPYGQGTVRLPGAARVLVLPERPYFPLGTLRQAVCAPAAPDAIADTALGAAMGAAGLDHLIARLDAEEEWTDTLPAGDQQRIGFARALLARPDVLIMDNPVSALPEAETRALFLALERALPNTIVVTAGTGAVLASLHGRALKLSPRGQSTATEVMGGDACRA
jgi:putative ATP-binding cassette transporter